MLKREVIKVSTICDGSLPCQIAGSASTLTRSLMHLCSRLISSEDWGDDAFISRRRQGGPCSNCSPLTEFGEELLRWHKEGILLKNAADDHHRVCTQNIDDGVTAEFRKMISANDNVIMFTPNIVHARLELNN